MMSFDAGRLGSRTDTAQPGRPSSPPLSAAQHRALAILYKEANKHSLRIDAQPGDIILINNWALLHARDSYADEDSTASRHLVRLWLRNSKLGWDVPQSMRSPWEAAFGPNGEGEGSLNGTNTIWRGACVTRKYAVVPELDYKVPKYTTGSAAFVMDESDEDG
jgi:hypothetical protein